MRLQTRPPHRAALLGAAAVTVAATALLPAWYAADAAPPVPARATLVQLTDRQVDAIGLNAYHGVYGTAVSTAVGQDDNGNFSDPDSMLARMTIATMTTRTSSQPSKNYAQAQLTGLTVGFNGRDLVRLGPRNAGSVGSLDSYAECVPPPIGPWALAYNRTDAAQIFVLGRPVPIGTTLLTITGADLGLSTIGPSTLTVTVTQHQDPTVQSRQFTARAALDINVAGTFNDTGGTRLYQGDVTFLRLGEVQVSCRDEEITPSPTPPTPTETTPGPPTPTDHTPRPPTPTRTENEETASPTPTTAEPTDDESSESGESSEPGPGPSRSSGRDGHLADTGASGGPLLLGVAATAAAVGTGATLVTRRRRARRH
ncbi:hypothetical protein [Streptacidiphilus sp. EB129]|uniref:hypothetical protein n=1 Tax=Streptacidiphilus sp. EB129 TaxID=3156262 RepID=UPI00351523F2